MGFFTIAAGSGVLGAEILDVGNYRTAATVLWFVALAAQREGKPQLHQGIQGNWLLGVVFYLWVITLILQRLFFYDLPPGDLSPTHTVDRKAAPHHGSVVGWFHANFVLR